MTDKEAIVRYAKKHDWAALEDNRYITPMGILIEYRFNDEDILIGVRQAQNFGW